MRPPALLRAALLLQSGLLHGVSWGMPPKPGGGAIHISPGCLQADGRHSDLWCPGDAGYECYKIPTLLRIPNTEHLLAFIEARKHSCDDRGYIDLMLRRSPDNGVTWEPAQLIYSNSSESDWHTIGDALPVYDAKHGGVHLIFTRDNLDVLLTHSMDKGATWSSPRDISASLLKKHGKWVGTGHDHGLQLRSGRLLVPMYGGGSRCFLAASDDHGASWRILQELPVDAEEWAVAVTGREGGLIASVRSGLVGRRLVWSEDGGESWSKAERALGLPEPIGGCEGAMFLHPNGKLYFSHPDNHFLRQIMMIKVSEDEGHTWRDHQMVWGPGHGCDEPCVSAASYSSMSALGEGPDSDIGIFYMRNNQTMLIFEGRGASFTTLKAEASHEQQAQLLV